jgi:phenylacetic acid degradation operon negative regulatory protein
MRIVHEYRLFPYRDPDLPLELLPHDWAGTYAHESFSTAHRLLRGPADRYFRATVR